MHQNTDPVDLSCVDIYLLWRHFQDTSADFLSKNDSTSKLRWVCNYAKLILTANQNSQSTAETDFLTECHNQNIRTLEHDNI